MKVNRWTIIRRLVQCGVVLLLASPAFGWSFFDGNLAAASLLGLQLSDPLATLQILLLTGTLSATLLTGTGIVLAFYGLLGGRVFCGWICPVHLLTDLAEMLPWARRLPRWSLGWKWAALLLTGVLSLLLGVPAFEILSPIGVSGRLLGFGLGSSVAILVLVVLLEWLLVRRGWCRSLCPLGAVYALLGRVSPLAVAYKPERCSHCGECERVCCVPEVLAPSLTGAVERIHSGECSRCGACVGICPDQALNFGLRRPFET